MSWETTNGGWPCKTFLSDPLEHHRFSWFQLLLYNKKYLQYSKKIISVYTSLKYNINKPIIIYKWSIPKFYRIFQKQMESAGTFYCKVI